jgi:hypothetical protein
VATGIQLSIVREIMPQPLLYIFPIRYTYSCHHNSSPFTFPIFVHARPFSGFHSLQSITPRVY